MPSPSGFSGSGGGGGFLSMMPNSPAMNTSVPSGGGGGGIMDVLSQGAGKASDLLNDENFQMFLAELGAQIGQGGAGEAIGKPTQSFIQRDALSQALASGADVDMKADGGMKIQQKQGQTASEPTEPSGGQNTLTGGKDLDTLVAESLGGLGRSNDQGGK